MTKAERNHIRALRSKFMEVSGWVELQRLVNKYTLIVRNNPKFTALADDVAVINSVKL